jgi:hypothetical protein
MRVSCSPRYLPKSHPFVSRDLACARLIDPGPGASGMSNGSALLDPAILRPRADTCRHLVARLPPGHHGETLLRFAREHDEIASKLEASIAVLVSPPKAAGANG